MVAMYLLPAMNVRLQPRLRSLKAGHTHRFAQLRHGSGLEAREVVRGGEQPRPLLDRSAALTEENALMRARALLAAAVVDCLRAAIRRSSAQRNGRRRQLAATGRRIAATSRGPVTRRSQQSIAARSRGCSAPGPFRCAANQLRAHEVRRRDKRGELAGHADRDWRFDVSPDRGRAWWRWTRRPARPCGEHRSPAARPHAVASRTGLVTARLAAAHLLMSGRRLMALDARDGTPAAAFGNWR